MPSNSVSGIAVTAFTIGAVTYLAKLQNASLNVRNISEDGKGVADRYRQPVVVATEWDVEGEWQVSTTSPRLTASVISNDVSGALTLNTGAGTYSGNVIITVSSHRIGKNGLQTMTATMEGDGVLTFTPPV